MSDNLEEFIFPVIPSPHDGRDYIYEQVNHLARGKSRSKLPKTLDLRVHLNPPRNQGKRGTCVAFACSAIKEYQERFDAKYYGYFSPESIYYYRSNKPNSGMFLRDAMKILNQKGACIETYFPYSKDTEPTEIPDRASLSMEDFKIKEYSRVQTIEGLKEALCNYGPCLIAFPVYDVRPEFWRASSSKVESRGGHAVAVVGYNEKGFILRNSWGDGWNKNGCVLYPYDEWGTHWEAWSSIDAESRTNFLDQSFRTKLYNFFNNICNFFRR